MTYWAVAITTAPREGSTLKQTVDSVLNADWVPMINAEPGTDLSAIKDYHLPTIVNKTRLGVWYNWKQAAKDCLAYMPDAVLLLQDDIVIHPETKSFVEGLLWPDNCGYISLYTPRHYQQWYDRRPKPFGVYYQETASMWGACALVFHPNVLEKLLDHPKATNWLGVPPADPSKRAAVMAARRNNPALVQNSDTIIGAIIRRHLKRKMVYINPSPAEHIAVNSSCGHKSNFDKRNAVYVASHKLPLAQQVNWTKGQEIKRLS